MHDPDFLAVEIHAPIPIRDRWYSRLAREGKRRPVISRRTNAENLGERTYPWWKLEGYTPRIGNHVFRFPVIFEAWHHEPGDADMGTVCQTRPRGLRWVWQHRDHLRWRCVPYRRVRHMLDRCHDCRRRFGRRARFGLGWDDPRTFCRECSDIHHLRHTIADLAKYVRGENNWTEGWRVERAWLGSDEEPGTMVVHFADLGVGPQASTETGTTV